MYVKIFKKVLSSPTREKALSDEEKAVKERIENDFSFEELRILRDVAMHQVTPPPPSPSPTPASSSSQSPKMVTANKKNFLSTWFPQWWYSTSQMESVPPATAFASRSSIDDEIMDVIAGTSDSTFLKRDVVFGLFNFSLKQGSIRLCAAVFEHKKLQ